MGGTLLALGLMSGTSMDGVDAALIETDGETVAAFGPSLTVPYPDDFRRRLKSVLGGCGDVAAVARELTDRHAHAVELLMAKDGRTPDVIGFHGHTILHAPVEKLTWQIGEGDHLAMKTGVRVVADFRSRDVTEGGQGAPLVPVFHAALAADLEKPLAVLNVGGVANVTYLGAEGDMLAFDTGPGNALIDDWMKAETGVPRDEDGRHAAEGGADAIALERLLANPYFAVKPPKSLDRDAFSLSPVRSLTTNNGAATLTRFTSKAVALAIPHMPEPPKRWLVCGGGRHNATLMADLREDLAAPVDPVEVMGWDGDALEAQAFGFLAVRTLRGLPLTFPETTGVKKAMTGGRVYEG